MYCRFNPCYICSRTGQVGGRVKMAPLLAPKFKDNHEKWAQAQDTGSG